MRKAIIKLVFASIAFVIGVATTWIVQTFGESLIDESRVEEQAIQPADVLMLRNPELGWCGCECLIVTMDDNGNLLLNSLEVGNSRDFGELISRLRAIFQSREDRNLYSPSPDLSQPVPERRMIDRTVIVKASASTSYRALVDLIGAIREAEGEVGLLLLPHIDSQ